MDGFTFYKSFYETLKKIRKKADRAQAVLAVVEFMFDDEEPQGLSEVGEIAFESFRHTLTRAKKLSKNGSQTKANQMESANNQTANTDNQTANKTKSKANQKQIKSEASESESYSLSLINNHPPTTGARTREETDEKMTCAEFLSKYPNINPDTNIAAYGLDWELLDEKFQESTKYLQGSPHDLSWVKRNYRRIIADAYKDKEAVNDSGGMGYNGMAFFDEITENLKAREGRRNDG